MSHYSVGPSRGLIIWSIFVVLFIIGPLIMIAMVSFTPHDYISFSQQGLSLRWYRAILARPEFIYPALNSLYLAIAATAAALILGLPAAFVLARYTFRGRLVILGIFMSPLLIPHIFSALAILTTFSSWRWTDQPSRLFVAHTILVLPYVIRTLSASLLAFNIERELAAQSLGASRLRVFFSIILPDIKPAILAALIFSFIIIF